MIEELHFFNIIQEKNECLRIKFYWKIKSEFENSLLLIGLFPTLVVLHTSLIGLFPIPRLHTSTRTNTCIV